MEWIDVNEEMPEIGEDVLIAYKKGKATYNGSKGIFITQGNLDECRYMGLYWQDYTGRLLRECKATTSKNVMLFWAKLPALPKL